MFRAHKRSLARRYSLEVQENERCSEGESDEDSSSVETTPSRVALLSEEIEEMELPDWLTKPVGENWIEIVNDQSEDDLSSDTERNEWIKKESIIPVVQELPLHHFVPRAARECILTAMNKSIYYTRLGAVELGSLAGVSGFPKTSDLGLVGGYSYCNSTFNQSNNLGILPSTVKLQGDADTMTSSNYEPFGSSSVSSFYDSLVLDDHSDHINREKLVANLPPFSSLSWLDRQLVAEWRTIHEDDIKGLVQVQNVLLKRVPKRRPPLGKDISKNLHDQHYNDALMSSVLPEQDFDEEDDIEYTRVRTLIPPPAPRPLWAQLKHCSLCPRPTRSSDNPNPPFSTLRRRHHCRLCGTSICGKHANFSHPLPELGYNPSIAERVCVLCKIQLSKKDWAERIAWKQCRLRDYFDNSLTPYFTPGIDTMSEVASRFTTFTITLTRRLPNIVMGPQTTLALETIDLVRKHGLNAVFGFLLRKEFIQAAELLMKVIGIDKNRWPISWKEMTLGIFYALAAEKYRRGARPNHETHIHRYRIENNIESYPDNPSRTENRAFDTPSNNVNLQDSQEDSTSDRHHLKPHVEQCETAGQEASKGVNAVSSSQSPRTNLETPETRSNLAISETGTDPSTKTEHGGVCLPVPSSTIESCLLFAPLALSFLYAECEIDLQLLAAQQGWRLLYAQLDPLQYVSREMSPSDQTTKKIKPGKKCISSNLGEQDYQGEDDGFLDKPAYAVLVHEELRIACWGIRGTATLSDIVMDIRAMPVPFPDEVEGSTLLKQEDHQTVSGEEWGVNPAFDRTPSPGMALCGMARAATNLFRENLSTIEEFWRNGYKIRITGHSLGGGVGALLGLLIRRHLCRQENIGQNLRNDFVRVYGYGTPACLDQALAKESSPFTTTVVLHDDVIPRLTPTSIRNLLKYLMYVKKTWVDSHFEKDLESVLKRAKQVWAPRFRGSFVLPRRGLKDEDAIDEVTIGRFNATLIADEAFFASETDFQTRDLNLLESLEDISNDESDEDCRIEWSNVSDTLRPLKEDKLRQDDSWSQVPFDEPPLHKSCSGISETLEEEEVVNFTEEPADDDDPVVLKETRLPHMYIPGKIIHIYTENGAYKAAHVPRNFREIRRISLAGNMMSDHTSKAYYEALLEVQSVQRAKDKCPPWVGFLESSYCSCCASRFTWASTSDSAAQEARDKHNCRACGQLVCAPCSSNRTALPKFGIETPVRICDACYHNLACINMEMARFE